MLDKLHTPTRIADDDMSQNESTSMDTTSLFATEDRTIATPACPLPYNGEPLDERRCCALDGTLGLYTQCYGIREKDSNLCRSCNRERTIIEGYGTIQQRVAVGVFDYVDPLGRKPVQYVNIMKFRKLSREEVEQEAAKLGIKLLEDHFNSQDAGRSLHTLLTTQQSSLVNRSCSQCQRVCGDEGGLCTDCENALQSEYRADVLSIEVSTGLIRSEEEAMICDNDLDSDNSNSRFGLEDDSDIASLSKDQAPAKRSLDDESDCDESRKKSRSLEDEDDGGEMAFDLSHLNDEGDELPDGWDKINIDGAIHRVDVEKGLIYGAPEYTHIVGMIEADGVYTMFM
jgi:RNA polymerase subunit RPABC4/transcription elongation factor Spt4